MGSIETTGRSLPVAKINCAEDAVKAIQGKDSKLKDEGLLFLLKLEQQRNHLIYMMKRWNNLLKIDGGNTKMNVRNDMQFYIDNYGGEVNEQSKRI